MKYRQTNPIDPHDSVRSSLTRDAATSYGTVDECSKHIVAAHPIVAGSSWSGTGGEPPSDAPTGSAGTHGFSRHGGSRA